MKKFLEKSIVLLTAFIMVFAAAVPVYAAPAGDGSLVVTSYAVNDKDINKGETVTVTVSLKHTSISASDIGNTGTLDI